MSNRNRRGNANWRPIGQPNHHIPSKEVSVLAEPDPIPKDAKQYVASLMENWSETQSGKDCIPASGIHTPSQFQQYTYNNVLKPGRNGIDLQNLYAHLTYYFETYPVRTETTHASCFSPHTSALYAKQGCNGKIADAVFDSVLKAFLMLSSFGISPWTRNSYGEDGFQSAVQATKTNNGTITTVQLDKVMAAFAYVTTKMVESICRRHFNKLTAVPDKHSDTYKDLLRCFVAHPKEFMMMVCETLGFVKEPKLAEIRPRHWVFDLLNDLMTDVTNNFNGYSDFFKSTLFNNVEIEAKKNKMPVTGYCIQLMFLAIEYLLTSPVKGDTEELRLKKQDRRYLTILGVVASLIETKKFDEYLVQKLYPKVVDLSKDHAITKTQQMRIAYTIAMMYQNRKLATPDYVLEKMKPVIGDERVELCLRSSIRVMLNLGDVPIVSVVQVTPKEDDKSPVPVINPRKAGFEERLESALSSSKLQEAIMTAVYDDLAVSKENDKKVIGMIIMFLIEKGRKEQLIDWFKESLEYGGDDVAVLVMGHVNSVKN